MESIEIWCLIKVFFVSFFFHFFHFFLYIFRLFYKPNGCVKYAIIVIVPTNPPILAVEHVVADKRTS